MPDTSLSDRPREIQIVLPTFGRPDALAAAVRSGHLQTWSQWRLLVIGDASGPETAQALAPFIGDSRVRYVNLPARCGEQALLNSAGMVAARGRRTAVPNHDDVWLPTHLETAVANLDGCGGLGFFMGRSLWAGAAPMTAKTAPRFEIVSPVGRSFQAIFRHGFEYVEPVSAWVVDADLAAATGPGRRAIDGYRLPIHDWVLRACRAGARLVESPVVTCRKFQGHWARKAPARNCDTPAIAQQWCVDTLERADDACLALLQTVERRAAQLDGSLLARFGQPVPYPDEALRSAAPALLDAAHADEYLQHGIDAFETLCAQHGIERGQRWRSSLKRRTGESGLVPPAFEPVCAWVRDGLDGTA